eukprot:3229182-Pyramimonas_sp.AAC.1
MDAPAPKDFPQPVAEQTWECGRDVHARGARHERPCVLGDARFPRDGVDENSVVQEMPGVDEA